MSMLLSFYRSTRRLVLLLLAAAVVAAVPLAGCQPAASGPFGDSKSETAIKPSKPPAEKLTENQNSQVARQQGGDSSSSVFAASGSDQADFPEPPPDDLGGGKLIEEIWDAYSMQQVRVGYSRTTIAKVADDGRELIRTRNFTRTVMHRAGQTVTQDMTLTSWDTEDGRLVRFESRMSAGPGEVAAVGRVRDGQLGIEVTTLGRTQSMKIPWQAGWGGFFAPDQSLRRQPLRPGEKRSVRSLLPIFNIPGDTHLEAVGYEEVELPGGPLRLLKVNNTIEVGGQKIETVMWLNDRGEAIKSVVPSIGQEAVRTTKEDALRRAGGRYDILLASTVKVARPLLNAPLTRRVVYRAHVTSGDIRGLFSEGLSQRVKLLDDRTAEITVVAVRPTEPAAPDVPQPPPSDDDRSPSNFIQSDDRQVAELAARVAPDETDPWKIAVALEKSVNQAMRKKNFSQAFATAAEVARSLEGDCTEHAVLLAALCRSRKLPARVAFGLVYYPPEQGFAYHMWTEVWTGDRWVPLDATLGAGGVGADRLQLGDSSLAGGSPLADLLRVISVFGRLELEVVEVE